MGHGDTGALVLFYCIIFCLCCICYLYISISIVSLLEVLIIIIIIIIKKELYTARYMYVQRIVCIIDKKYETRVIIVAVYQPQLKSTHVRLCVCLSVCLSVRPSVCVSVCLCVCLCTR